MEIYALYEGTFSVGLDKKFFPMEREGKPAKNSLRISVQPFLVIDDERKMLFDPGLGEFGEGTSVQTLLDHLAEHDIEDFEITDIFLSHLHFDHVGGLAHRMNGFWELTFPDAKVHLNKYEWEKVLSKEIFFDEEKTDFANFLDAKADLNLLENEDQPIERISNIKVGGHSEFHIAYFYENGDDKFIMAGDVLPTKGHVNQKFAAKYDYDPKESIRSRKMLTEKAWKENYLVLAFHSSQTPIFRLSSKTKDGYEIEEIGESVVLKDGKIV